MGMSLKPLLPILFLLAAFRPAGAQDCSFTFTAPGNATQPGQSNISGNTPCANWRITFSVTGSLQTTVTFQTSPDNLSFTSVPNTVCSSTAQPPCLFQGANPLTGNTQGMSLFAAYGSYVRVTTSSSSGTGSVTIRGYGAKGASAAGNGNGGGGGGGSGNPAAFIGIFTASVPAASEVWSNLAGLFANVGSPPAFEQGNVQTLSAAGSLKNFIIVTQADNVPAGGARFTVMKNGIDTAVTILLPAGAVPGIYSDLVDTVTWSATDLFTLHVTNLDPDNFFAGTVQFSFLVG
jgi:hypothetical protein